MNENELLLMETIHLFVELLDQYFSNVCELDIVFHFNKVYALLDEFILAGEVQETSKKVSGMKSSERADWVKELLELLCVYILYSVGFDLFLFFS